MVRMILDPIPVWNDCILSSVYGDKGMAIDVQVLGLLLWLRMDERVYRLRYHLALWVRKLLAEACLCISSGKVYVKSILPALEMG